MKIPRTLGSRSFIEKKLFDGKAIVSTITIQEKSTVAPTSIRDDIDSFVTSNHRATRIILPNGKRYVLDYWEYMGRSQGKVNILEEKKWIKKWRKDIGIVDSMTDRSEYERNLEKYIDNYGEKKGIEYFLQKTTNKDEADTMIRSWKKEPWGKKVADKLDEELLEESRIEREKMAIENEEIKQDRLRRIQK